MTIPLDLAHLRALELAARMLSLSRSPTAGVWLPSGLRITKPRVLHLADAALAIDPTATPATEKETSDANL